MPITTEVVSSTPAQGEVYTPLCDKVCQWLAVGQWFSPGPPVSYTNKTDRHDVTEMLLKVALNTIRPNQTNQLRLNFTGHYQDAKSEQAFFVFS
jgi:hypothetical protein